MNTEQLYTDFTTKLLPIVQEGMSITKEYFLDLFGRYVKYLLATDIAWIVVSVVVLVISISIFNKGRSWGKGQDWDEGGWIGLMIAGAIGTVLGAIMLITNIFDLIKTIYVPEIRIYEELKRNTRTVQK